MASQVKVGFHGVYPHKRRQRQRSCHRFRQCAGAVARMAEYRKITHSTEFRGEACHRSAKAAGGEDLQVKEPIACGDCASLNLHTTLAGMLRPTLIGDQVIEVRQPCQKRLLATPWVMKAFHRVSGCVKTEDKRLGEKAQCTRGSRLGENTAGTGV